MKTIRTKQAKVQFAYFVQRDQRRIIAKGSIPACSPAKCVGHEFHLTGFCIIANSLVASCQFGSLTI